MRKEHRSIVGCIGRTILVSAAFMVLTWSLPANSPLSWKPQYAAAYGESELEGTSGKCGDKASWTFDPSTGVLTISGSGKIGGKSSDDTPFYKKTNITKVVIKKGITELGYCAFSGCTELKEVVLPNGMKVIGSSAFQGCSKLSVINLPDSITDLESTCFSGCKDLTVSKLPSNLETMGWRFLAGTQTTSITVPGTVKEIEYHVFGDSDISEVILEEGIEKLGQEAFNGAKITKLHLPASLTSLRSDSLECTTLQEITIDADNPKYSAKDGVVYNKNKSTLVAFPATRTGSFKVPKGVTEIGADAFIYTHLDSVTLPDSVTKIGAAAFRCSSIKTVNIPKNVYEIGLFAFDSCKTIEGIYVDDANETFADIDGVLFTKDLKKLLRFPSAREGVYVVPDSVTEIDRFSFDNCSLTRVVLPRNLKKIGELAFRVSYSLKELVIPESVTELEMNIFSQCSELEHLVILSRNFTEVEGVYNLFYFPALCQIYGYEDARVNGQLLSEYIPENFHGSVNYVMNPIRDVSGVTSTTPMKPVTLSLPKSFGEAEWITSDPTIASVDQKGKVTPEKGGLIDVFAMNGDVARHYQVLTGFTDVNKGTYYYDPVYWAVDRGITGGVKNKQTGLADTFNPQGICTRGQMAAFLWRMAGCPEPKSTKTVFKDIKSSDYFYKAVLWGEETGIIGGYSDKTFRPDNECTRAQAVTFLWRYYEKPEPQNSKSSFGDVKDQKAYYYKAVLWATENKVTGGYSDGTFKPDGKCSRAQMVTFLYRSRTL